MGRKVKLSIEYLKITRLKRILWVIRKRFIIMVYAIHGGTPLIVVETCLWAMSVRKIEEINIAPNAQGGLNFGWRLLEGNECFNPSSNCRDNAGDLVDPILTYQHGGGDCSVTGGYVYEGSSIPDLTGKYIYGDFCSGKIRVATNNGGQWSEELLLSTNLGISSFGEDKDGELYVVDYFGGGIHKIIAA